jgi:uncharacterized RDD family membrane protein YckC
VAGFWIRFLARSVDIASAVAVGFLAPIVALIVLAIRGEPSEPARWIAIMGELSLMGFIVSYLGSTLCYSISEFIGGVSLGKLVCGLRVVSEDFAPVSFRGALIRSAVLPIDGLFLGLVAYGSMKQSPLAQRLGDSWGGTTVVVKRRFPAASRAPLEVLLGLSLGLGAWVGVRAIWLVVRVTHAV